MSASRKVGVFYGRMNPFTRGHQAAVQHIKNIGKRPIVVISHSENNNKNPLSVNQKRNIIRKSIGNNIEIIATSKAEPSIQSVLKKIKNRNNVNNIELFLGSNRIPQFQWLTKAVNVKLTPFGARRNNSNTGLAGISGTKSRTAARSGNVKAFTGMMPVQLTPQNIRRVMNFIQAKTPKNTPAPKRRKK